MPSPGCCLENPLFLPSTVTWSPGTEWKLLQTHSSCYCCSLVPSIDPFVVDPIQSSGFSTASFFMPSSFHAIILDIGIL